MRSNDANGQKKAPTRGSRDGNTHARRAAAHPNVHLTPRTAGQLPTWGQVLVHALVRAQFGIIGAYTHATATMCDGIPGRSPSSEPEVFGSQPTSNWGPVLLSTTSPPLAGPAAHWPFHTFTNRVLMANNSLILMLALILPAGCFPNTRKASGTDADVDTDTGAADADGDGVTVVQGDCDDTDAGVGPGVPEDCTTPGDDNCDGDDNDPGAIGCSAFYGDGDGDTFGAGSAACMCIGTANFSASNDDDCNDTDATVNPFAEETCDGADNDCDGRADDEDDDVVDGSSYYDDRDHDGYGDPSHRADGLCGAPAGTVSNDTDCYDGSVSAHPGQITYFTSDRGDHNFDFDCDGRETPRYTDTSSTGTAGYDEGWVTYAGDYGFTSASSVPACGTTGYYYGDGSASSLVWREIWAEGAELVWSRSSTGYGVLKLTVACR